ncbi:MAG: acyloxyacyl hydrolase, partial [Gammaproteobacteria bacterium]|nr:acyloxyacyl hydrolase [Gammaproteobacteria bacterium]
EAGAGRSRVDDPPYFTVGAGAFDFEDEDTAADFRLEYRSDLRLLIFKPFIGLSGTSDSAVFLYGGLGLDLYVAPRWVITPNAA